MITAILLAAGQSKRLRGENKLTKLFKGKPLINHILFSLIKSKVNNIVIVLGYEHLKIKTKLLKSKKINFVINKNYKKGMSSSIKTASFLHSHGSFPQSGHFSSTMSGVTPSTKSTLRTPSCSDIPLFFISLATR